MELFDKKYAHRISKELKEKVINDMHGSGFISRGIIEAIRLLECESVAQSTRAMKHKERKLNGLLSNYWHIHVSEDNMTRTFNNIGNDNSAPVKNPNPDEVIKKGVRTIFIKYLKGNNIPFTDGENDELCSAICSSNKAQKDGIEKTLSKLQEEITPLIQKIYFSNNKITGDWLIYWKSDKEENYYLEHYQHIDSNDASKQQETKKLLDGILADLQAS